MFCSTNYASASRCSPLYTEGASLRAVAGGRWRTKSLGMGTAVVDILGWEVEKVLVEMSVDGRGLDRRSGRERVLREWSIRSGGKEGSGLVVENLANHEFREQREGRKKNWNLFFSDSHGVFFDSKHCSTATTGLPLRARVCITPSPWQLPRGSHLLQPPASPRRSDSANLLVPPSQHSLLPLPLVPCLRLPPLPPQLQSSAQ